MATPTGEFRGFEVTIEDPGIVLITFNQPDRLNGFTVPLKRDLIEILTQVQMDEAARVVIFTGTGRGFSAGDDITEDNQPGLPGKALVPDIPQGYNTGKHLPLATYNALRAYAQPLNRLIRGLDKLTIAAINGYAIQTGLSLALCCDFRIASTEAKLGSATLRFGLQPDEGGPYLLIQLMGVQKTMEFLMRKRIVDANEARDLGLVNEVVEPGELMPAARALAQELAEGPQVAMRMLKHAVYNAAEMTFEQHLADIATKTCISDAEPDAEEGMTAWREKRKPRFNRWMDER